MSKPLSIQLYTVRNAIAKDLDSALERVAALGFTTVELYDFVERAEEYAHLLTKHGLHGAVLPHGTHPEPGVSGSSRS